MRGMNQCPPGVNRSSPRVALYLELAYFSFVNTRTTFRMFMIFFSPEHECRTERCGGVFDDGAHTIGDSLYF